MASFFQSILYMLSFLTMIQGCLGSLNSAEKVSLDLYYESLCPDCSIFMINELPKIFKNGMIDIVNLRLFPWGNGWVISNNTFICQHGPKECLYNSIEACAIDAWPKLDDHFPFITCVENLLALGKYSEWDTCFAKLGLDPKPVTSCYKGEDGKKLQLKYAALTDALEPPHTFVPWVVIDGEPIYEDYDNFISYICKAYKGTPPNACNKASYASVPRKRTNHAHRGCYAVEQTTQASVLLKIWSFVESLVDQII